jgi:hypothetical protein
MWSVNQRKLRAYRKTNRSFHQAELDVHRNKMPHDRMELFENGFGGAINVKKDADLKLFAMRFDTSSSCDGGTKPPKIQLSQGSSPGGRSGLSSARTRTGRCRREFIPWTTPSVSARGSRKTGWPR